MPGKQGFRKGFNNLSEGVGFDGINTISKNFHESISFPSLPVLIWIGRACSDSRGIYDPQDGSRIEGGESGMPEVILEVANPTTQTFYIHGQLISYPDHHKEVLRDGKWMRMPLPVCGFGSSYYPLRPGAKVLVTVDFPWEESCMRYRFFFWKTPESNTVISVRSRPIESKELGDFWGSMGKLSETTNPLEEIESDEQLMAPLPVSPFSSVDSKPSDKN